LEGRLGDAPSACSGDERLPLAFEIMEASTENQRGERAALEMLARVLPGAPPGETWFGDDAAVVRGPSGEQLLFAIDCVVSGVHFDLRWSSLPDVGWKVLSANVSDIAAMGGRPIAAVVAVAGPRAGELEPLYAGLIDAGGRYGCPVVGGDLSAGAELVVSVAVLGSAEGRPPVLRSGARPGDRLFVTGALGRSAAGLRLLAGDARSPDPLALAHRRPEARPAEGRTAALAGATAMIDVSDGLGIDLDRLATASKVGVQLDRVPIAEGATLEEALGGGEDYELVFAAPAPEAVLRAFSSAGLALPEEIGSCVEDASARRLGDAPLPITGFEHRLEEGAAPAIGIWPVVGS
jgi:thiamine-monophosphate kinase